MDSFLVDLSLIFIKIFNYFLPMILNNNALFLNNINPSKRFCRLPYNVIQQTD